MVLFCITDSILMVDIFDTHILSIAIFIANAKNVCVCVCLRPTLIFGPTITFFMVILNSKTDKLGMEIFSQLEPVFRSDVSILLSQKCVENIRTIIFKKNFFLISQSLTEICRVN